MATLVLLSGGMDSTIALFHAASLPERFGVVHALTFDYQQRHRRELEAATKVWSMLGEAPASKTIKGERGHFMFSLDRIMPRVGSLMTSLPVRKYGNNRDMIEPDPAFIPHRNLLFVTVAALWARQLGAHEIVTGFRGGYADCTEFFEQRVHAVLAASDPDWSLDVTSPMHKSRLAGINMAKEYPGCMDALAWTMTCFEGTEPPCGACLPCLKRAQGFRQAGIYDPLMVRLGCAT